MVEEAAVDADRVAAHRRGPRLGHVAAHVLERLGAGVVERQRRRLDRREQRRLRVHRPHEVVHLGERLGRLVHDEVDAVVERLELRRR